MTSYRVYQITLGGPTRWADDLNADDVAEAIRLARVRNPDGDLELWCGTQKVASVPQEGAIVLPSASAFYTFPPGARFAK